MNSGEAILQAKAPVVGSGKSLGPLTQKNSAGNEPPIEDEFRLMLFECRASRIGVLLVIALTMGIAPAAAGSGCGNDVRPQADEGMVKAEEFDAIATSIGGAETVAVSAEPETKRSAVDDVAVAAENVALPIKTAVKVNKAIEKVAKELAVPVEAAEESEDEKGLAVPLETSKENEQLSIPVPAAGEELSKLTFNDEVYTLIEYDAKIAVFSETGSPVTSPNLVSELLYSYSWQDTLKNLDLDEINNAQEAVREFDFRLSGIRGMSGDTVATLGQLETLNAEVPLLGKVSALDVIGLAHSGMGDTIEALRIMDAELASLHSDSAALEEVVESISEIDVSETSGTEAEALFMTAGRAASEMRSKIQPLSSKAAEAQGLAGALEKALRQAADTPAIGDTLGEYAETVQSFRNELYDFSSLLHSVEDRLDFLATEFQASIETSGRAHKTYLERWLQNPPKVELRR